MLEISLTITLAPSHQLACLIAKSCLITCEWYLEREEAEDAGDVGDVMTLQNVCFSSFVKTDNDDSKLCWPLSIRRCVCVRISSYFYCCFVFVFVVAAAFMFHFVDL